MADDVGSPAGPLSAGNALLREFKYGEAMATYVAGLFSHPQLAKSLAFNISLTAREYRKSRAGKPKQVAVCASELSHNVSGRAYAIARTYDTVAEVEILGTLFPRAGRTLWQPIVQSKIPCKSFVVDHEEEFFREALSLVASSPREIVHLCRMRGPTLIFGALFKIIWGATVLVDFEDDPSAKTSGSTVATTLNAFTSSVNGDSILQDLLGKAWAGVALGLADQFDGVTVANPALVKKFGGNLVRTPRGSAPANGEHTPPAEVRSRFGIGADTQVILIVVGPRSQGAAGEILRALSSLRRSKLCVLVVGSLGKENRKLLEELASLDVRIGDQATSLRELAQVADLAVVPTDAHEADACTVPSAVIDLLAAGIPLATSESPALKDILDAGAAVTLGADVAKDLASVLDSGAAREACKAAASAFFREQLSVGVNAQRLKAFSHDSDATPRAASDDLLSLLSRIPGGQRLTEIRPWPQPALAARRGKAAAAKARPQPKIPALRKLPITVLVVTWDIGHNPLGRSFMLAEVLQRVVRHCILTGFQFPRYGEDVWEPVRNGSMPVLKLPGRNFPEFLAELRKLSERVRPDVIVACKARFPSVALGMLVSEKWGCPLVVDIDDHELSFFNDVSPLPLASVEAMPEGSAKAETEPYGELWTRLANSLCNQATEIIVSNPALQQEFGGTVIPHVRDELRFDPALFDRCAVRSRYGVPVDAKIVLFFGTPRAHKGIDTIARAVGDLPDATFRLLVVGSPPDRRVVSRIGELAKGRVIFLPNQPFSSIPEIVSMADVVCLPQDESHAVSKFQLPAKAIDAVAMGVPLLVSNTPPLMELVRDGVAELISPATLTSSLLAAAARSVGQSEHTRATFLAKYSHAAAAIQLRQILERALSKAAKSPASRPQGAEALAAVSRALDMQPARQSASKKGVDIVVFWKQNDTGLYGRRHDMVIKYLASREDVRKVLVFDAPASEFGLMQRQQSDDQQTQDRWIYLGAYEKAFGLRDTEKTSFDLFIYPPGRYRPAGVENGKPDVWEGYRPFLEEVFRRENVDPSRSIFWIYPKNFDAPRLVNEFRPKQVVVDVVDDHRSWPGISDEEKTRLSENYRETLALADFAFSNCEPVQRAMQEYYPGIRMVPNGCDSTPPTVQPKNSPAFDAFRAWPGKTIGYIGNLESKLDVDLLDRLARELPECQLALIGSSHTNDDVLRLKSHANVCMPGVVPYDEAGAWVSRFDVGLVPHLRTELTQSMNPLKVFVYLAFGVPVVSTDIDNVDRDTDLVRIAGNHDQFIAAVKAALAKGKPDAALGARYVEANSWAARFKLHVDEVLARMGARKKSPRKSRAIA
jgi:glycosyltransferase involved in cell wall biosynthesis